MSYFCQINYYILKMKKLLLLASATFFAGFASAQVKVDWGVEEIINPSQLNSTATGTNFGGLFVLKNYGTDSALAGDTVLYRLGIKQASNGAALFYIPGATTLYVRILNRNVPANDTIQLPFNVSAGLSVPLSANIIYEVFSVITNGARGLALEVNANNTKGKNMVWYNVQGWGVSANQATSSQFSISPNPATNTANINLAMVSTNSSSTINVFNMAGQLVHSQSLLPGVSSASINTQAYTNGTYTVQVTVQDQVYTQKLIKL